jgi:predicted TIM-barrel fold metal-dependent hydrolase
MMLDHFGRPDIARGVKSAGYQTVLEFGKSGQAVIKLSGPFRSSLQGYPYTDVDSFIAAAIDAFTLDNCVWGSDWPFVRMDERMDYGRRRHACRAGYPTPKIAEKVLWDTPARLFGFR